MTQNPFSHPPHSPFDAPLQPSSGNGGNKTLLIVISVIGAILMLFLVLCGVGGFLVVREVRTVAQGLQQELQKVAAEEQARHRKLGQVLFDEYKDDPMVVEQLGEIRGLSVPESPFGPVIPNVAIELQGDQGTGTLQAEYLDLDDPSIDESDIRLRVILIKDGKRTTIDDHAVDRLGDKGF